MQYVLPNRQYLPNYTAVNFNLFNLFTCNINLFDCSCIYIVFIVCIMSFIDRVVLCSVFCLSVVCYLCVVSYCNTTVAG
jgi:hypothetical protein